MLEIIIFTILISTLINLMLKQFEIPTIIGYIATGTIIAYGFDLHASANSHELKEIAEFGVVFLMFTIGLEFSLKHLMRMKKEVFLFGSLQVFITATVFTLIANKLFGIELKSSIIIGAALALSSTAIILKLLNESGDINKIFGRKVLGILLFQDIAVIPILLMITIFSVTDRAVSSLLFETFVNAVILLSGLFVIGKYLIEPFFSVVTQTKSNEIFISSVLLVIIGSAYVAHLFGFSYSLGAFIAGMMIAETQFKHQVEADLIPFRDLLLGVFFITVGMQLNFQIIAENIVTISLLLPMLILVKVAIVFTLISINSDRRSSIKSALTLFQFGEFALVIFELSFARGLLDPVTGQILIVIVIISMILTPFMLKHLSMAADFLTKEKHNTYDISTIDTSNLTNHAILIGYGRLGKHISKLLAQKEIDFIAIENDIQIVKEARRAGVPIVYGNASQKDILKSINIKESSSVIISIGNSHKLNHICEVVNELTHNTRTVVKVNNFDEKESLANLNLTHIIVETENTAIAMFKEAVKCCD